MEADGRTGSDDGGRSARASEENLEEARGLSPIEEEEAESALRFRELSTSPAVNKSEGNANETLRSPRREHRALRGRMEGDSSSEEERTAARDYYRLRRVKGSYCRFEDAVIKEAEASGDNDAAETGLRDKSLETTVEQLKCRLSRAEREIVALKRQQRPQKCRSHESCETLERDLLSWRDDHEKMINSQIVRWQTAESRRIQNEMENTRRAHENIRRQLEALERRSARSCLGFRRQIDVWEKRLRDDVVGLHENNLTELRELLGAWLDAQNAINSSNIRREEADSERAVGKRGEPCEWNQLEATTTLRENDVRFLERIIKFEVQRRRDDLARRMDRKVAKLWSAFENFKHNFHLDRGYRTRGCVDASVDDEESIGTEDSDDLACRESARSDVIADSEERRAPRS